MISDLDAFSPLCQVNNIGTGQYKGTKDLILLKDKYPLGECMKIPKYGSKPTGVFP